MRLQKKSLILLVGLLGLLLASCSAAGPTNEQSADDQSGGGVATPDQSQAGGGIATSQVTVTPFLPGTQPTSVSGQKLPEVNFPAIQNGGFFKNGNITFTLVNFAPSAGGTTVDYTVTGLAKDYVPISESGEPRIEVPGGAVLEPTSAKGSDSGGGSPGAESAHYEFPALPAGTTQATLAIDNTWSGKAETWRIPVSLQP